MGLTRLVDFVGAICHVYMGSFWLVLVASRYFSVFLSGSIVHRLGSPLMRQFLFVCVGSIIFFGAHFPSFFLGHVQPARHDSASGNN